MTMMTSPTIMIDIVDDDDDDLDDNDDVIIVLLCLFLLNLFRIEQVLWLFSSSSRLR